MENPRPEKVAVVDEVRAARRRRRPPCSPSTGGSTCRPLAELRRALRDAGRRVQDLQEHPGALRRPGPGPGDRRPAHRPHGHRVRRPATPSASPRRCRTSPRPTRPSWSRAACSATGPRRGRRQGPGRPRAPRGAPGQVRRPARRPAAAVRRPARGRCRANFAYGLKALIDQGGAPGAPADAPAPAAEEAPAAEPEAEAAPTEAEADAPADETPLPRLPSRRLPKTPETDPAESADTEQES